MIKQPLLSSSSTKLFTFDGDARSHLAICPHWRNCDKVIGTERGAVNLFLYIFVLLLFLFYKSFFLCDYFRIKILPFEFNLAPMFLIVRLYI